MQAIYLDTSIFVKENFLEGKRIQTLLNLFEVGKFQLIMSLIAVNEVKARFKRLAKVTIEKHNELLNTKEISYLRNVPESKSRLIKYPNLNTVSDSFNILFDKALADANAIILDYPVMNVGEVFDDYFAGRYPFGSGDKKLSVCLKALR
ncbi:MAG: hypothetical protein EOO18_03190 [Chryseobacterium sp.]|nr:MAG: hypothetical protein EOO18_03190 [Chryseobacterium sp.]